MKRTFRLAVGTICLFLGMTAFSTAGSALPPTAVGPAATKPINTCVTILESGSYRVAKNLVATGDCLVVAASYVELNLGGFTITGDGTGSGVKDSDPLELEGIDVRNGTITKFQVGIDLVSTGRGVVKDVRAIDNTGDGILAGVNSVVAENIAMDNGGLGINAGGGSSVTRNIANFNGSHGLQPDGCTVVGNSAFRNGGDGIHAVPGSGTVVTGNRTASNDGNGISVSNSVVRENVAISNDLDGINATCPSSIVGNTVTNSGGLNIFTFGPGCVLADNATN